MNITDEVFKLVKEVPKGKVVTYKQIAVMLGLKTPRIVGYVLHRNKQPEIYPCHRVVKSDGTVATGYAFGGLDAQKDILQSEGVIFKNNKVDLSIFRYNY